MANYENLDNEKNFINGLRLQGKSVSYIYDEYSKQLGYDNKFKTLTFREVYSITYPEIYQNSVRKNDLDWNSSLGEFAIWLKFIEKPIDRNSHLIRVCKTLNEYFNPQGIKISPTQLNSFLCRPLTKSILRDLEQQLLDNK